MTWISTYPHDGWFAPQTVTLSVCAPGEVLACRIGGALPSVRGVPCVCAYPSPSLWRPWGASNPGCAHKGARTTLLTTYSNLTMAPKMAKVPQRLRIEDVFDLDSAKEYSRVHSQQLPFRSRFVDTIVLCTI